MKALKEFFEVYGGVPFNEMPFCDADAVALCQTFYMPIERVAPGSFDDEPMSYTEVCNRIFELNGNKHVPCGLVLLKSISRNLMMMSATKRYGEMKVVAAKDSFGIAPAVQFGAVTLLLPDGSLAVIFRGTDDTLIGWLEDIDIYTNKGIPSHNLAVEYLDAVAEKFDGPIYVCGHSKGGNVALYAGLNCKKETRDRIKALYNNDGPGFDNYEFIESEAYVELLPRYKHYIPQSSLVGTLLAHDDDYTVIKSSKLLGTDQHDLTSWRLNGADLERYEKGLTLLGKFNDMFFAGFIMHITDNQGDSLEKAVSAIIAGTGCRGLMDFAKNLIPAVRGAKDAWKNAVSDEVKADVKDAVKGTGSYFLYSVKTVVTKTGEVRENAKGVFA